MGVRFILFPLDIVFFLQFVAQIHICESVFPVQFTYSYPITNQDVYKIVLPSHYQCIELCAALKLCRRFYFYSWSGVCTLMSDDEDRQPNWMPTYLGKIVLKESIPPDIGGSCGGHTCAIDEMCVPAGPTYICVKHELSTVKCPLNWGRMDDLCFSMIRGNATWTEAGEYCVSSGAELLMMESASDYYYHQSWITYQLQKNTSRPTYGTLWTGLQYTSVLPDWVETINEETGLSRVSSDMSPDDWCIGLFFNQTGGSFHSSKVDNWQIISCEERTDFICQRRAPEHWP